MNATSMYAHFSKIQTQHFLGNMSKCGSIHPGLLLETNSNETRKVARIEVTCGPDNTRMCQYQGSGEKSYSAKTHADTTVTEVTVAVEVFTETNVSEPPKSELAAMMLKWFDSEDFGNVTIVASDGKKFRCHRDILARRSPVFDRMFSCPMKESRENLVDIEDFNSQIVAQLLLFVYSDECEEIGSLAERLYAAADQYQLDRLKSLCECALAANLSVETVLKTYEFAIVYHLDDLLDECDDYWHCHKDEMSIGDLLAMKAGRQQKETPNGADVK